MSRPELTGHASLFYNEKEARKYDSSSRMVGIQREITERAIELLKLPSNRPSFILDVGCGSGLSGQVLEEHGHVWVGCDVSRDMLNMANERIERKREEAMGEGDSSEDDSDNDMNDNDSNNNDNKGGTTTEEEPSPGDLLHHDMGTGLPFRPASFDACISISALQWLCYSNTKEQIPKKRLTRFFSSLYQVLRRGARAVLQFYPESSEHAILISECAAKVGFAGGIVVDYPNSTKAKKHYLVLSFERSYKAPQGLTGLEGALLNEGRSSSGGVRVADKDPRRAAGKKSRGPPRKKKGGGKTKEWILHKKETQRKKGKDTRKDTKFTGRKRPMRF
uniref:18S rRNA (guanine(1575)-N(7))-methyltransferase Bud23 C-terminal domain-containing protein n=1 Tax=Skeletonema marinoi TaxID=267567 RepID=A0A7S2LFG2_9STRA|mmetsp:Transcript_24645/g.41930  ORF Transcript_24645/g.41930 Transcript_24645/m.41930 type:complete len:334 (+) Transcript_24645:92-1093(+)